MIGRYALSIALGTAVTLGLLYVMQLLIKTGEAALTEPRQRYMLEFVRVRRNENLNTDDFQPEKPPKPPEVPPETPPQDMDDINADGPTINVPPPSVSTDVNIGGPGALNVAEGDYLPIVRVAPVYPARALSRGLEGFVDLEFFVTEAGTVRDPVVIQSTSSLFERAAISAVLKFKYKPRVVAGVKTRITFKIEE
jgi:protein TonB